MAVLPFTGQSGVQRGAGEWFAHKLEMNARYRVLTPGEVEVLLGADAIGRTVEVQLGGPISTEEARRHGISLGVRVVVVGELQYSTSGQIKVTLIDVTTGEEVSYTSSRRMLDVALTGIYPTTVSAVEESAKWALDEIAARSTGSRSAPKNGESAEQRSTQPTGLPSELEWARSRAGGPGR